MRSGVKRPTRASNRGARVLSQRSVLSGCRASLRQEQPGIIGASSLNILCVVPQAGEFEMEFAGTIHAPGICAIVSDVRWNIAAVNGHGGPAAASDFLGLRWSDENTLGKSKRKQGKRDRRRERPTICSCFMRFSLFPSLLVYANGISPTRHPILSSIPNLDRAFLTENGAATDLNRGQSIHRLDYLTDAYDWSLYVCAWQIHPRRPLALSLSLL